MEITPYFVANVLAENFPEGMMLKTGKAPHVKGSP